jgi:hypothetical protein
MLNRWRAQRASAYQLLHYWDDPTDAGRFETSGKMIEPALRAAVRQIALRDDAPPIDPAFSSTLLNQLLSAYPERPATSTDSSRRFTAPANGRAPAAPAPMPPAHPRLSGAFSIASTAVLLLLIGMGLVIWNMSRSDVPAIIPLRSETISSGIAIETLLEQEIPAGQLPENSTNQIGAGEFILEPGMTMAGRPSACDDVPVLNIGYVVSGVLELSAPDQFELTRAGGQSEIVSADMEARLGAGDSWILLSDTPRPMLRMTNVGTVTAHVLQSEWWLDKTCLTAGPTLRWGDSKYVYDFDRTRPVRISLETATIPAGTTLSPDEAARLGLSESDDIIFCVIGVQAGSLIESWVPDALTGAAMPATEPQLVATTAATQSWTISQNLSPPEGQERQFSAGEGEPLQVTIYTFVYDD